MQRGRSLTDTLRKAWDANTFRGNGRDSSPDDKVSISKILQNKATFELFMTHLSKEFSMECLLSVTEMIQFKRLVKKYQLNYTVCHLILILIVMDWDTIKVILVATMAITIGVTEITMEPVTIITIIMVITPITITTTMKKASPTINL